MLRPNMRHKGWRTKDSKTMTSGYNRVAAAPAWPSNGTGWIEQELCIEPLHVPVQYTLTERAHDEGMEEVEWIVSMTETSVVLKRLACCSSRNRTGWLSSRMMITS